MDDKNPDAYDGFDARPILTNRCNRKFHGLNLSVTIEYIVEGVGLDEAFSLLNGIRMAALNVVML